MQLTQQDLSNKLSISTIYVRKIEKGVANPGRETMIKYENFFKTDMRKLFPDLFFDNNDKKLIKRAI
ncbi:XRE family transcriptional regulator [Cytobacillus horneckiae]|uniref:XRE family transcriptional regulator n=2 Tax=Cytobacillus horneckiae TaxID=549687 RepID=A0A2N0ZH11_9BACI|nr:XRE family transcriptional regulator [Cytobacillus horneckiae]